MSRKTQRWRPDGWDEAKKNLLTNWKWDGEKDSIYALAERLATKMLDTLRKQGIATSCSTWECTDEAPCGSCPIGRTAPGPEPADLRWPGRMVFIPDERWAPPAATSPDQDTSRKERRKRG